MKMNDYGMKLAKELMHEVECGVFACGTAKAPEVLAVKGDLPCIMGLIAVLMQEVAQQSKTSVKSVANVLLQGAEKIDELDAENTKAVNTLLSDVGIEDL